MPLAWTWSAIARTSSGRVAGAELGGLGDGDGQRLGAVLVAPAPGLPVDQLGGQLAVGGGDLQQLDAADPLRRAVFVHVDVRRRRADHGAPAGEQGLQRQHVGAGAVEDREAFDAGAEVPFHEHLQPGGVVVFAVGDLVALVGCGQGRQDFRVDARVVVGGEAPDGGVVEPGRGGGRGSFNCGCHRFGHAFSLGSCPRSTAKEQPLAVQFRRGGGEKSDGGGGQVRNVGKAGEAAAGRLRAHVRRPQGP